MFRLVSSKDRSRYKKNIIIWEMSITFTCVKILRYAVISSCIQLGGGEQHDFLAGELWNLPHASIRIMYGILSKWKGIWWQKMLIELTIWHQGCGLTSTLFRVVMFTILLKLHWHNRNIIVKTAMVLVASDSPKQMQNSGSYRITSPE